MVSSRQNRCKPNRSHCKYCKLHMVGLWFFFEPKIKPGLLKFESCDLNPRSWCHVQVELNFDFKLQWLLDYLTWMVLSVIQDDDSIAINSIIQCLLDEIWNVLINQVRHRGPIGLKLLIYFCYAIGFGFTSCGCNLWLEAVFWPPRNEFQTLYRRY